MSHASRLLLCVALLSAGGAAMAQGPAAQAYNRCLTDAAMEASYGTTPEDDIYRLARLTCANARAAAVAGQERNHPYLAALDAADAEKVQNFPAWIKGVRERRRLREAQNAKP